jgi:uncharacterized protein (UPF0333 family)
MKGQTAFEYLILFSLVLVVLSILILYSQQITESNREDIMAADAITAVNKITEASDIVYTQGKPSQITLSVYIPDNVYSINCSDKMIIMKINIASGISDIFSTSKATLNCTSISIMPVSILSGMKKIKVIAEEDYVNITEG